MVVCAHNLPSTSAWRVYSRNYRCCAAAAVGRDRLGGEGVRQSFLATIIGAVSYFATMTEAPFVDTLMGLGMGKGPALALLLTGPGISLPNWLAIGRVFGAKKAMVYIPTIIILGTLVGWVAGFILF